MSLRSSSKKTAASEGRSRLLASVPVLLGEDLEFEELYSSSAFDSQQADLTITASKETQHLAIPPITSSTQKCSKVKKSVPSPTIQYPGRAARVSAELFAAPESQH